jgi:hypothetical protein
MTVSSEAAQLPELGKQFQVGDAGAVKRIEPTSKPALRF